MTTDTHHSMPYGIKWRSSTAFIISTLTVGMFTDLFLYGLLVPVVPFLLPERVHTPPSEIQSQTSILLAAYAISQAVFALPIGVIADWLPNRQTPFLFGLMALFASTILLYLGTTFQILILARILQGFSAGVVWSVGLALVLETVGSKRLGVTIGGIFGFVSAAELVAPPLGGILYDKAGLEAVFGVGFGLLGVDFVMRLLVIERKVAKKKYGLVFEEDVTSTPDEGNQQGGDEQTPLLSGQHGDGISSTTPTSSLDNFKVPKDPPKIFTQVPVLFPFLNPRVLAAMLATLTQALLLATFDATLTLHASALFDFTSLQAGILFIPLTLPALLLGPLIGHLIDTHGTKLPAVLGLGGIIAPLILLRLPHAAQPGTPDGTLQIGMLSLLLVFSSIFVTLLGSPGLVEASYVTEQYHKQNPGLFVSEGGPFAKLYAFQSLVFSLGLAIGPMVSGRLRESIGWGNMMAVTAGICAMAGVVCWFFLGGGPVGLRELFRRKPVASGNSSVSVDRNDGDDNEV